MSELSSADYGRLVEVLEENSSRSMEAMRIMLAAMKEAGDRAAAEGDHEQAALWHDFDTCWSNAIQRIRVQPYMDEDEAAELLIDKKILASTKPAFRAAFNGEPMPSMNGDSGGTRRNGSADSGIADH